MPSQHPEESFVFPTAQQQRRLRLQDLASDRPSSSSGGRGVRGSFDHEQQQDDPPFIVMQAYAADIDPVRRAGPPSTIFAEQNPPPPSSIGTPSVAGPYRSMPVPEGQPSVVWNQAKQQPVEHPAKRRSWFWLCLAAALALVGTALIGTVAVLLVRQQRPSATTVLEEEGGNRAPTRAPVALPVDPPVDGNEKEEFINENDSEEEDSNADNTSEESTNGDNTSGEDGGTDPPPQDPDVTEIDFVDNDITNEVPTLAPVGISLSLTELPTLAELTIDVPELPDAPQPDEQHTTEDREEPENDDTGNDVPDEMATPAPIFVMPQPTQAPTFLNRGIATAAPVMVGGEDTSRCPETAYQSCLMSMPIEQRELCHTCTENVLMSHTGPYDFCQNYAATCAAVCPTECVATVTDWRVCEAGFDSCATVPATCPHSMYQTCLSTMDDAAGAECLACGSDAIATGQAVNDVAVVCDTMANNCVAQCGTCVHDIAKFVSCATGKLCTIDDDVTMDVSPPPPQPVPTDMCAEQREVYQQCMNTQLENMATAQSCTACIQGATDAAGRDTCEAVGQTVCTTFETECAAVCAPCLSTIVHFINCQVVEAATATPGSPQEVCTLPCTGEHRGGGGYL